MGFVGPFTCLASTAEIVLGSLSQYCCLIDSLAALDFESQMGPNFLFWRLTDQLEASDFASQPFVFTVNEHTSFFPVHAFVDLFKHLQISHVHLHKNA